MQGGTINVVIVVEWRACQLGGATCGVEHEGIHYPLLTQYRLYLSQRRHITQILLLLGAWPTTEIGVILLISAKITWLWP